MHGLILSGGEGTRLGPLGLQRSKCLITVGGKPMIARQYQLLKEAGCDSVTVVVAPRAVSQVVQVIESADLPIFIQVQENADGPVDAILTGLSGASDTEALIMFADTLLDEEDMPVVRDVNTVILGKPSRTRNFCVYANGGFRDQLATSQNLVCVGAYLFQIRDAERAAGLHTLDSGMDGFLNALQPEVEHFAPSWQDVGDIAALAEANRNHFISRSFNDVALDDRGVIVKRGSNLGAEVDAMENPPAIAEHLYPRFVNRIWTPESGLGGYSVEFVPLPTLAELYLYWPREQGMWTHITSTLLRTLEKRHWTALLSGIEEYQQQEVRERAERVYVQGIKRRYAEMAPLLHKHAEVNLNGDLIVTGERLLQTALRVGRELTERALPARIHGDPNFTNILWSLETDTFKLIDPRGEWGGPGSLGDIAYDLGKIAYSPIFARVAHGLFELKQRYRTFELRNLDVDPIINWEVDSYFTGDDWDEHRRMIVAWLLLAGAPLHQGREQDAMYLMGAKLMQEWV